MATLNELYTLIHSLDKHEKKHLSIMVAANAGKAKASYNKSLSIINTAKTFDEEKLRAQLSKNLKGVNLSEANTNLYNFISNCLVSMNHSDLPNIGHLKELAFQEIILNKGLHEMVNKQMQPLKEKIRETGTLALLQRAYDIEYNTHISIKRLNLDYKSRYKHYKERLNILAETKFSIEIALLNTRFFELAQTVGDPRTKNEHYQYLKLWRDPILQSPFEEVPLRSLSQFITLKLAIDNMVNPGSSVIDLSYEALEVVNKRIKNPERYNQIETIVSFMLAQALQLKNQDATEYCVRELENLVFLVTENAKKLRVLSRIFMAKLSLCIWNKDIDKTDELVNEWMSEEMKPQWINFPLAYINFLFTARLYYLSGKPSKALDYLLMLQQYEKQMRPNLYVTYRFLIILCHYKLKDYELLSYSVDSLYRFLHKMEKIHGPEKAILRFLKKCTHYDKVRNEMAVLYEQLLKYKDANYNASIFAYGDYLTWLSDELKLNTAHGTLTKEKSKKRFEVLSAI